MALSFLSAKFGEKKKKKNNNNKNNKNNQNVSQQFHRNIKKLRTTPRSWYFHDITHTRSVALIHCDISIPVTCTFDFCFVLVLLTFISTSWNANPASLCASLTRSYIHRSDWSTWEVHDLWRHNRFWRCVTYFIKKLSRTPGSRVISCWCNWGQHNRIKSEVMFNDYLSRTKAMQ